jgi:hypothetical protein
VRRNRWIDDCDHRGVVELIETGRLELPLQRQKEIGSDIDATPNSSLFEGELR